MGSEMCIRDSVFVEPPQPPASVKYVNVTINLIQTVDLNFSNISGIFPSIGNTVVGTSSGARLTVTKVVGNVITGFITQGTFILPTAGGGGGELCTVSATGFSANIATRSVSLTIDPVSTSNFPDNADITAGTVFTGQTSGAAMTITSISVSYTHLTLPTKA